MQSSTVAATNFKLDIVAGALDSSSLRDSAMQISIAPTSLNGCVSELSFDTGNDRRQNYAAAIKNYAAVYEEYQSYLMPMELQHDYDLAARLISIFSQSGCLTVDLLDSNVRTDHISDDDIESYGYMAWVHH